MRIDPLIPLLHCLSDRLQKKDFLHQSEQEVFCRHRIIPFNGEDRSCPAPSNLFSKKILGEKSANSVLGTIVWWFSYAELVVPTKQFSRFNIIGIGGSSSVYRGQLGDGQAVAVKKLEIRNGPDADREFLIEVEFMSRLHHFHLVPLIGYCIEFHRKELQRLLAYEYMPNGNLREHGFIKEYH